MSSPNPAASATAPAQLAARQANRPAAVLGLCGALAGAVLALNYPLAQPLPLAAFACVAVAVFLRPKAWLVLLPALLPIIGFAPWTGWIVFEEFDLLVLAVVAGGYMRLGWPMPARAARPSVAGRGSRAGALIWLCIALFAISTLVSLWRGFVDAGGFAFGWFQGYREPMNSLRLAKPFFAALLLYPLWSDVGRDTPDQAARRLSLGLILGLLGASIAALWERIAFTDLLNFSADYRTTALFWEMHVGGAALDGFLALTLPFAVREMLVAPTKLRWAFAAAVTALAAYACLTTFSRGVYLAVPAGLGLMWALHAAQQRRAHREQKLAARTDTVARLALVCAFMLAAAWMFAGSGYRGMLALIGALLVLVPLGTALQQAARAELIAGSCIGVVLALLAAGVAWLLPRGPYIVYTLGVLFSLSMLGLHLRARKRGIGRHAAALALGGYLWVLTGMALVAWHWGGDAAFAQATPVLAVLLAAAAASALAPRELWPQGLRWQGNTLAAMAAAGGLVAAFGGGAYMGERFAATEGDLSGRLTHWKLSASMLHGIDDWVLGKGLGRYVESYAIEAPENLRPGDYRLQLDGQGQHLKLTGGGQLTGDRDKPMAYGGDMLRLSQRVALPAGRPQASLDVRASQAATLGIGVCTKHLLYSAACMSRAIHAKAMPGEWQRLRVELKDKKPLSNGGWYAPQLVVLAIGVDSSGGQVEVDNLVLTDADGRDLLSNGDFSAGLAHWFFTSDRSHLPWHAKNMALHVLFDQGFIGLTLLAALSAGALWRVCLGNARAHTLAPSLAGAIVGFAMVGLFDSLLDVPRVAFVFYGLLLVMLTLPMPATPGRNHATRHHA